MAYVRPNFETKKELRTYLEKGMAIEVFFSLVWGRVPMVRGRTMKDGKLVSVRWAETPERASASESRTEEAK